MRPSRILGKIIRSPISFFFGVEFIFLSISDNDPEYLTDDLTDWS